MIFSRQNKFVLRYHFFNYVHKSIKLHEHPQFSYILYLINDIYLHVYV